MIMIMFQLNYGEFNKETKFVIDKFNLNFDIQTLDKLEENTEVILVDHNEVNQSISNISELKVKMVVDHHKIDFKCDEPIVYLSKVIGSTSTIIFELLTKRNLDDNFDINILLLSAIISDTLLLKSPTTTETDKKVLEILAKKCNINIEEYGFELLSAGSDLSDLSEEELLNIDSKEFDFNDNKSIVSQINAVDLNTILSRQNNIENEMNKMIDNKNLDLFVVLVTDVLNCNSEIIVLGNKANLVEKAFNVNLVNNRAYLKGVVSRKKQVAPQILAVS